MTRILFIHQNFPGQFKHLTEALSKNKEFQIVGLGENNRIAARNLKFNFPVLGYTPRAIPSKGIHHYLESFEQAVRRGQDVVRACQELKGKGFYPDIIIGHPAWGEVLFIKDVFPNARLISFFEYFYQAEGGDVNFDPEFPYGADAPYKLRIRNSTQVHALSACDAGVSPTQWQRSTYPIREQSRIRVIHEGIDVENLAPNPQATYTLADGRVLSRDVQVVTFVSRNLEPYRGFHSYMRAIPELQKRLPEAQFVLIGGDSVSYGSRPPEPFKSWKEKMLQEVGKDLDLSRIHFLGSIPYADYVKLLQISKLHIYFTYPFVLSWSMLEAMVCGAPVLASSTAPVQEVIREGENGFLFDFFNRDDLITQAVKILSTDQRVVTENARVEIINNYSFANIGLPGYLTLISEFS